MKLEKLDLSVRTFNILKREGIDTVEELAALSEYSEVMAWIEIPSPCKGDVESEE